MGLLPISCLDEKLDGRGSGKGEELSAHRILFSITAPQQKEVSDTAEV